MAKSTQLTLAFPVNRRCIFDTFVVGANAELITRLQDLRGARPMQGIWMWGEASTGKSHLLQAACQHVSGESELPVAYLPLGSLPLAANHLDGLDRFTLVALDDVQLWLGTPALEAALIALYQAMAGRGGRLLVAAPHPSARYDFHYPDLRSRLAAFSTYRVRPLDDHGLGEALRRAAEDRGLVLNQAVSDYWLTRRPRELVLLLADLDKIDALALAAGRRLTIPLLRDALGI